MYKFARRKSLPLLLSSVTLINVDKERGQKTMTNTIIDATYSTKDSMPDDVSAAKLSHEINNYLSVLYSEMQYMENKHHSLQEDKDWITLKHETKNLSSTLYKLTYPTKEFPKEYFLLNNLLDEIYGTWRKRFQKRGYALYYIYEQSLPIQFLGYPSDFVQIMNNLLSNSYDALSHISRDAKTVIVLKYYKNQVLLKIEDNGCGISSQDLEHIFDCGMSKKQSGHGIGLSVVKELVQKNAGYISVNSTINKGTSFCLSFRLL